MHRNGIWRALGGSLIGAQQRRTRSPSLAGLAAWLGAGAVVGGSLAALLTPHEGREMRRRLGGEARRAGDYVLSLTIKEDEE